MKKKITIIMAGAMLAFSACTKKNNSSNNNSSGAALNSKESQLVGTWYLKKRELIIPGNPADTKTGFTTACYAQFTSTAFTLGGSGYPANYKTMQQAFLAADPANNPNPGVIPTWWYYDETAGRLDISGSQFEITTLTGSNLEFKSSMAGSETIYYFTK